MKRSSPLENHLMRPIALPQAKGTPQITLQHGLLLDTRQQRLINFLLVLRPPTRNLLLLRAALTTATTLIKERLLATLLVRLLVPLEVVRAADFLHRGFVEPVERYGRLGRDDVARVHAAEWDAVDFEGAGDEQDALFERFEQDHALAAEATGEEDEHFAWCEGGAGFVWALGFAGLLESVLVGIVSGMVRALSVSLRDLWESILVVSLTYLPWYRLILSWVVFEGLVGGGWNDPLALLEFLRLRLGLGRRHCGGLC